MAERKETGKSAAGAHRLESLMWCPRAFGFSEIAGYEKRIEPRARARGSAFHAGLAAHYNGEPWRAVFVDPPSSWAYTIPEVEPLLTAYCREYPTEPFGVVAIEQELRIEVGGLLFTRRVDLLYEQHGKLWGMDHKTAGRINKRLVGMETDATLFTQDIVGAVCAQSQFGLPWGGVVVNLVETGNKTNVGFQRRHLRFPARIIEEALREIEFWSRQAKSWIEAGLSAWDLPKTLHCQRPWGWCDYRDLCLFGPKSLGAYTTPAERALDEHRESTRFARVGV